MAISNVPFFTQSVTTNVVTLSAATAWTIGNTSTANTATLVTAGANGTRVNSITLATTDTAANNVFLLLDVGGTGTNIGILGQINVPSSAGTQSSVLVVDALSSVTIPSTLIDNNGKRFIHLAPNDKIRIGVFQNMTAAKVLFCTCSLENY